MVEVLDFEISVKKIWRPWPGPNSNTFVQAVLDSVPELGAVLPPTAIGKDFPYTGRWMGVSEPPTPKEQLLLSACRLMRQPIAIVPTKCDTVEEGVKRYDANGRAS